jgi:type II secretory ATPase GspE/PulE/Tfp pilus assembly ATPase PilB-like protein
MGIEPYLAASSVECFIAQRLVRLICPDCRVEAAFTREVIRDLGIRHEEAKAVRIYEGKGCEKCKFTGYRGRTAIYEFLIVSESIKEMIVARASSDRIKKKAVSEGMRSLAQDGWMKIKMGLTTPAEILRVAKETS